MKKIENPLAVPYYTQQDSATGHASRMCFSSTCAMLLEYLKPGTLAGKNGDDAYLKRVLTFGDTTVARAQVQALASYGLSVRYSQEMQWQDVLRQLAAGKPVPMGILHHGTSAQPTGGGHWILAIGTYDGGLVVHDPFGEIDLVGGGWSKTTPGSGRSVRYSAKNLEPRWRPGGSGGWGVLA